MPIFQDRGPRQSDDLAVTAGASGFVAIAVTVLVLINEAPADWTTALLLTSAAAASRGTYIAYRRVRTG